MQYHQNIIHAHRPYMSRTYHQPSPPQGPGSDHARMMCMDGSFAIAKLLRLYEINYGLRRANVQAVGYACSAALLLIFANVTRYQRPSGDNGLSGSRESTEIHLNTCVRALDELSGSWPRAKKAGEFLQLLQRRWELQDRSERSRATRRALSYNAEEFEDSQSKRVCTSGSRDFHPPRPSMLRRIDLEQRLHGQQGQVDTGLGLDLDAIVTGFPLFDDN